MNSPHQPNTWIGRLIGDRQRYRLVKRLGTGGMGDVFLAMDTCWVAGGFKLLGYIGSGKGSEKAL